MALLALLVALAAAQLPTPLTSYAGATLYGTDCEELCFNGTQLLQPQQLGYTNDYCTDERGCYWRWHLRVTPCSASLLAFDAEVGAAAVPYSQIDPAAHAALGFYCMQSGSGVTLQIRPQVGDAFRMEWRYEQTTCADALGALATSSAPFAGADTLVQLGVGRWYGSDARPLQNNAVNCDAPQQRAEIARPCEQCFAGTQLAPLERNASAELTRACGYMPGDAALGPVKDCPVRWHFCYDACTQRTRDLAVQVGASTPLRKLIGRALAVRAGAPDDRGRTLFALTDAANVQELDDGAAVFYLAWEYRQSQPEPLWRADARDRLFVALHFAMQTDGGELLMYTHQIGGMHALGAYAWDGSAPTGMDAVVSAAKSLSGREGGLVAGLCVMGAVLLISLGCNVWLCVVASRHHGDAAGSLLPTLSSDAGDAALLAPAATQTSEARIAAHIGSALADPTDAAAQAQRQQQLGVSVAAAEEALAAAMQRRDKDMAHTYMESDDYAAHKAGLDAAVLDAKRQLSEAKAAAGPRAHQFVRSVPGGASLLGQLAAGSAKYEQRVVRPGP